MLLSNAMTWLMATVVTSQFSLGSCVFFSVLIGLKYSDCLRFFPKRFRYCLLVPWIVGEFFSVQLLDHLCFLGAQDVPTGHRDFTICRNSLERCKVD